MATFTAARAEANFPVYKGHGAGERCTAWGTITVAVNPIAADIYEMCRVPAGATVVAGRIYSSDLDTNATETLDLDVGWLSNGTELADTDGFGNIGVITADVVSGVKPEDGYNFPFGGVLVSVGPKHFTYETVIAVTCVATAATFAAGPMTVLVDYFVA